MKFAKLLVAVIAVVAVLISTGARSEEVPEGQRQEQYQKMLKSVYKDFGVCVNFYRGQYDYMGWARWNDGSYVVIFQNEPPTVVENGLRGGVGPGISFENIKGEDGRHVHSQVVPMPGWSFSTQRSKSTAWTNAIVRNDHAGLKVDSNDCLN